MSGFQPGEVVDVTIKGARVTDWHPQIDELTVEYDGDANSETTTFELSSDQVTVERVAPAEWPPRPGDLWHDRNRCPWFAADIHDPAETDEENIVLVPVFELAGFAPDPVIQKYGPLTLVHREEGDYEPCGCDHHGDHAGCNATCPCSEVAS